MWQDYLRLSLGSLRKRFLRTSLTMIGIFIGIAAVVALISLGQGMQKAINAQFASVGTDKIIVQGISPGFGPPGQNTAGVVTKEDVKLIRQVSGVQKVAGRLLRSVSLEFKDSSDVLFAASLPKESEDRKLVIEANNIKVAQGRVLKADEKRKLWVGNNLWTKAHFAKPLVLGSKVNINGVSFEVVGLLDKIGAGRDDSVMMNEQDLREVVNEPTELSAIVAQVDEGENPAQVAEKIARELRKNRHQQKGFEDVTVTTSEELIGSINKILGVVEAVFIGIAAISLLVGGIGIMNTMYTSVLERTREIGIMKALGARNSDILWIFLWESALLGLCGGAIGVAIGILLSKIVEWIAQGVIGNLLKATFPGYLIGGALLFSAGVGTISGVFPARQASKMIPVDALRAT